MKKILAVLLSLALLLSCSAPVCAEGKKLQVVTTIFPIYDWVREVVGDVENVEITMLLDSGVDLHSFQPTVQDIVRISQCDVFLYVGGESDAWVEDALKEAVNPEMKALSLMEIMGSDLKHEEIVEGMEHEHDHDHDDEDHDEDDHDEDEDHDEDHDEEDHDHDEDRDHDEDEHDHDHEEEYDEHVWLSLRNASRIVKAIADVLGKADPDHAQKYLDNAGAYGEKLADLDRKYVDMTENAAYDTVLFGDRFPFRYLTEDYDLDYYAAFSGCSAETEASFATIVFLAGKMDELELPAVLTIENPRTRIAQTIVENTKARNQQVLNTDSMQGITAADVEKGVTYLSIMEQNLEVFRKALNRAEP